MAGDKRRIFTDLPVLCMCQLSQVCPAVRVSLVVDTVFKSLSFQHSRIRGRSISEFKASQGIHSEILSQRGRNGEGEGTFYFKALRFKKGKAQGCSLGLSLPLLSILCQLLQMLVTLVSRSVLWAYSVLLTQNLSWSQHPPGSLMVWR